MKNSSIEWTSISQNFWMGCTKISPGCKNCYAEKDCARHGHAQWGDNAKRKITKNVHSELSKLNKAAEKVGRLDIAFINPDSDFFEDRPDLVEVRGAAWKTIRACGSLIFILLTKRAANIAGMLPDDWGDEGYPNVCMSVTVENSDPEVLERIRHLRQVPARWRMISVEPLISQLNLRDQLEGIHWVICGGESGSKDETRPMMIEWARDVRDACAAAGVAFFFKQRGVWGDDPPPGVKNPSTKKFNGKTLVYGGKGHKHLAVLDGATYRAHPFGPKVDLEATPKPPAARKTKSTSPCRPTGEERADFKKLDRQVRKGLEAGMEAGFAFREIRDRELWRAGGHESWTAYCKHIGGLTRRHVNRLISASEISHRLAEVGPNGPTEDVVLPRCESQVRPLAKLKDLATQIAAWKRAVEESGGQPTEKIVSSIVAELIAREEPPPESPEEPEDDDALELEVGEDDTSREVVCLLKLADGSVPPPVITCRLEPAGDTEQGMKVDFLLTPTEDTAPGDTSPQHEAVTEVGVATGTDPRPPNDAFIKKWKTVLSEIRREAHGDCRSDEIIRLANELAEDIESTRDLSRTPGSSAWRPAAGRMTGGSKNGSRRDRTAPPNRTPTTFHGPA